MADQEHEEKSNLQKVWTLVFQDISGLIFFIVALAWAIPVVYFALGYTTLALLGSELPSVEPILKVLATVSGPMGIVLGFLAATRMKNNGN